MATAVQIELKVDEAGAISGLRTFDTAVNKSAATVRQLGVAGAETSKKLHTVGDESGEGLKKVGEHALNAHEKVHLLTEELGVHVPRAMVGVIASSEKLMTLINAMGTGLVAVSGAEIFGEMTKEGYEFYERLTDINEELRKYTVESAKAAQQKLFQNEGIEQTAGNLRRVNEELEKIEKRRKAAGVGYDNSGSIAQYYRHAPSIDPITGLSAEIPTQAQPIVTADTVRKEADARAQKDALAVQAMEQRQRLEMEQLQAANAAKKSNYIGQAAIEEQRREQDAVAALELAQQKERTQAYVNLSNDKRKLQGLTGMRDDNPERIEEQEYDPGEGEAEYKAKLQRSQAEATAQRIELQRQEHDEIVRLQNDATNAGLHGNELLEAERRQSIANFERMYGASATATNAINKKFHAEEMQRLDEEHRAVLAREAEAKAAGLTGIAKLQADSATRVTQIDNTKFADYDSKTGTSADADRMRVAEATAANASIEQNERQFADRVNEIAASSADFQISGFARIRAAGEKQLRDLQKTFDDTYGQMADKSSPAYQTGLADLRRGQNAIGSSTNAQVAVLARQNANDTAQLEDEAYRKSLPQRYQREQEIQDTYTERLRKYQQMLDAQEISQTDFDRRTMAAQRELNADMAAAARDMRDKLAGELEGYFSNPMEALKRQGEQAAAKFAATGLMKLGGTHVMDNVAEHGGFTGLGDVFSQGRKGAKGAPSIAGATTAAGALRMDSANIYITGRASFMGGGSTASTGSLSGDAGGAGGVFGSSDTASLSAGRSGSIAGTMTGTAGLGGSMAAGAVSGAAGAVSGAQSIAGDMGKKIPFLDSKLGKKAGGIAGAGAGLFSAFESNGGFSGTLTGAVSGAKLGAEVGGPIGAAVGAIAGGIMGFMGFGGAGKAATYDTQQVKPRLSNDERAYENGSMDYLGAYNDLGSLMVEAKANTDKLGPGGQRYYQDNIKKELTDAQARITREQKAGRGGMGLTAAQFHTGDEVTGFGDLGTSSREGLIHAEIGDFIVKPNVAAQNKEALRALNGGASMQQVAASYRSTMETSAGQRPTAGGSRSLTMSVHAIDSADVERFFKKHKHVMRSALNDSYAENSGGADA